MFLSGNWISFGSNLFGLWRVTWGLLCMCSHHSQCSFWEENTDSVGGDTDNTENTDSAGGDTDRQGGSKQRHRYWRFLSCWDLIRPKPVEEAVLNQIKDWILDVSVGWREEAIAIEQGSNGRWENRGPDSDYGEIRNAWFRISLEGKTNEICCWIWCGH